MFAIGLEAHQWSQELASRLICNSAHLAHFRGRLHNAQIDVIGVSKPLQVEGLMKMLFVGLEQERATSAQITSALNYRQGGQLRDRKIFQQ